VTCYILPTGSYDSINYLPSILVSCTDIWVVAISDETSFALAPD